LKAVLQNIISESDRLNRLIDKILDLEKFETGNKNLFVKTTLQKPLKNRILNQLIKNKKSH
jgi:signal transduction histidine kinase